MPDNQSFKAFICDIAGVIVSGNLDAPGPQYFRFYTDNRGTIESLRTFSTQSCDATWYKRRN